MPSGHLLVVTSKHAKSATQPCSFVAQCLPASLAKLSTSTAATTSWASSQAEESREWTKATIRLTGCLPEAHRTSNCSRVLVRTLLLTLTPGEYSESWVSSLKALTNWRP